MDTTEKKEDKKGFRLSRGEADSHVLAVSEASAFKGQPLSIFYPQILRMF